MEESELAAAAAASAAAAAAAAAAAEESELVVEESELVVEESELAAAASASAAAAAAAAAAAELAVSCSGVTTLIRSTNRPRASPSRLYGLIVLCSTPMPAAVKRSATAACTANSCSLVGTAVPPMILSRAAIAPARISLIVSWVTSVVPIA